MDAHRQEKTGLGAGLVITGDITAHEDLVIHGRVDGQINVPDHHVLVAPSASVRAKIIAHAVTIQGTVDGTVIASERATIEGSANVRGHMITPAIALADGAQFNGSVDPTRTEAAMQVAKYRQKQDTAGA